MLAGRQWQCESSHSYDRAKAGYVNLLLANQKSSLEPGDNKEMMRARRAFLEADHYLPLVNTLAELLLQHLPAPSRMLSIHDAGCGEGYYLGRIAPLLEKSGAKIQASGSDISKAAIEMAAKRYQQLQFAIASNFNIPLASESQHVVLQVFAPGSEAELHRILYNAGLWLRVTPAEEHLTELRAALYQAPQQHSADAGIPDGFAELQHARLRFNFKLPDAQDRKALLMMTPYFWSVPEHGLDAVIDNMAELTADFSVRVLRKSAISTQ